MDSNSKNVIVVCGMHRSGSTWLYNVIKISLELENIPVYCGYYSNFNWKRNFNGVKVIKAHDFDFDLAKSANLVFISKRDIRDVCASEVKRGLIRPTIQECLKACVKEVTYYDSWFNWCKDNSKETVIINYSEIKTAQKNLIREINLKLGILVNPEVVYRKSKELSIPKESRNESTLLHHGHIVDGRVGYYNEVLPHTVIKKIEQESSYIRMRKILLGNLRFDNTGWQFYNWIAFIGGVCNRIKSLKSKIRIENMGLFNKIKW